MRTCLCAFSLLVIALGTSCGQSTQEEAGKEVKAQVSIPLPEPKLDGKVSVEKAIHQRRSVRSFTDLPLTLAEVAQLLWAAQGVTDKSTGFRSVPSAGALFPLEVYLVAGRVNGLEPGFYRYAPRSHSLVPVAQGDFREALCKGALEQAAIREAPISLVVTGVYARTASKYGARAQRFVHMEAGHVGQNVALQAIALGLDSVCIGGYDDSSVKKAIPIPEEEVPLYILPVGHKR